MFKFCSSLLIFQNKTSKISLLKNIFKPQAVTFSERSRDIKTHSLDGFLIFTRHFKIFSLFDSHRCAHSRRRGGNKQCCSNQWWPRHFWTNGIQSSALKHQHKPGTWVQQCKHQLLIEWIVCLNSKHLLALILVRYHTFSFCLNVS